MPRPRPALKSLKAASKVGRLVPASIQVKSHPVSTREVLGLKKQQTFEIRIWFETSNVAGPLAGRCRRVEAQPLLPDVLRTGNDEPAFAVIGRNETSGSGGGGQQRESGAVLK